MIAVNYTKLSNGKILLQGENKDTLEIIVKEFDTFDEAVEYADNN